MKQVHQDMEIKVIVGLAEVCALLLVALYIKITKITSLFPKRKCFGCWGIK